MKMRLRDRSVIHGRGWKALIPETGAILEASSRARLIPLVSAHLRANNLPPMTHPEEDVDDYICGAMSEKGRARACVFRTEAVPPQSASVGLNDVLEFARFVSKNGISFVDPEEAARRAAICASCPWNVPMASHCPSCAAYTELVKLAGLLLEDRATPHDALLRNCGVCGCDLKIKVHAAVKDDYRPGGNYPSWCWQNKGEPHGS